MKVKKSVYVLLALFLGGLGAHEFYAGHNGKGIACVLLCWTFVPAIVALFKAFSAMLAKADEEGCIYR